MKIKRDLMTHIIGLFKYLDDPPSTLFQDMRVAMSVDSASSKYKKLDFKLYSKPIKFKV